MAASKQKVWICQVCGYEHTGDGPPDECPVCGVGPDQFEEFITSLEQGRSPLVDGREAKKAVQIIRAIYASAKKGTLVRLA